MVEIINCVFSAETTIFIPGGQNNFFSSYMLSGDVIYKCRFMSNSAPILTLEY